MGDVVCPDNLFDNIILNDAADVSLERDTSSLRLAELVPHNEDFSRQSDQENNDPVIRVVGDQEFILLEPGPSSVENSEGFDESFQINKRYRESKARKRKKKKNLILKKTL